MFNNKKYVLKQYNFKNENIYYVLVQGFFLVKILNIF